MARALQKTVWWFLKKINTGLPAISLSGTHPQNTENRDQYVDVHSTTAKMWKTTQVSMDR